MPCRKRLFLFFSGIPQLPTERYFQSIFNFNASKFICEEKFLSRCQITSDNIDPITHLVLFHFLIHLIRWIHIKRIEKIKSICDTFPSPSSPEYRLRICVKRATAQQEEISLSENGECIVSLIILFILSFGK